MLEQNIMRLVIHELWPWREVRGMTASPAISTRMKNLIDKNNFKAWYLKLTHSPTNTLSLSHSINYLLIHSLNISLTHSLTQSLTHSHTHSYTDLLTHPPAHLLTDSLNHSLAPTLIQSLSFTHSHTHWLIHSLTHSTHSFNDSLNC